MALVHVFHLLVTGDPRQFKAPLGRNPPDHPEMELIPHPKRTGSDLLRYDIISRGSLSSYVAGTDISHWVILCWSELCYTL